MMSIEEIANGLGNAEYQGADRDEPEGARYITISQTLVLKICRGLGSIRGQIMALEEKNAELVGIVEALEHRLGDPE